MPSGPRSPARRALSALVTFGMLLLTGCRTVVTVDVESTEDGSGSVAVTAELDAEAASALGGPERLALGDLAEAGWEVEDPELAEDGSLSVSATRTFRDSEELAAVLDELGGADAVFSDPRSQVTDTFGRTGHELATTVEVSGDPAQFSDAELTATLGGLSLGRTAEELSAAGIDAGSGELVVRLSVPEGDPVEATFDLTGGEASSETLEATSSVTHPLPWLLGLAGAALVLIGLALLIRFVVRRSRPGA